MARKKFLHLLKQTVNAWLDDDASSKGAAIAFYTLFSLAPLLTIVIAIAGAVFGQEAAKGELVGQIESLIGHQGAVTIQTIIEGAGHPGKSLIAALIGTITLLIASTAVFVEIKTSLDQIWHTHEQPPRGVWDFIRTRLLSFSLILAIGFLLLASLVCSTLLAALSKYWGNQFSVTPYLLGAVNFSIFFVILTVLFAMIYKLLPSTHIAWKDVWVGAVITTLFFNVGKSLIGIYLGQSNIISTFGAAGSIILVLLWIYYSAQIFLLGAEFTKVYAYERGSRCPAAKK